MEDTIISSKTAKLAQEKGFDIKTEMFYTDTFGLCYFIQEGNAVINTEGKYQFDVNQEFDFGNKYYAATQSLLCKWLRKEKLIHINLEPIEYTERNKTRVKWYYKIQFIRIGIDNHLGGWWSPQEKKYFEEFEEALEEALQQILMMIK